MSTAKIEISVYTLMIIQKDDITNCVSFPFNTQTQAELKASGYDKEKFYTHITKGELLIELHGN